MQLRVRALPIAFTTKRIYSECAVSLSGVAGHEP